MSAKSIGLNDGPNAGPGADRFARYPGAGWSCRIISEPRHKNERIAGENTGRKNAKDEHKGGQRAGFCKKAIVR